MIWLKNKKSSEIPEEKTIKEKKKRKIVTEVVLINNKTEKEYTYKSENNFGLDWSTVDGWLHIWQNRCEDGCGIALGAFTDFSIINVVWKNIEDATTSEIKLN